MTERNDDDAKNDGGGARPPAGRRKPTGVMRRPSRADQAAAQIGTRLRALYDEVVDEPIPDDFQALLEQLEEKDDADKS